MPDNPTLAMAECYYAVARDLQHSAQEQLRMAELLNRRADALCEQNMRESSQQQKGGEP